MVIKPVVFCSVYDTEDRQVDHMSSYIFTMKTYFYALELGVVLLSAGLCISNDSSTGKYNLMSMLSGRI